MEKKQVIMIIICSVCIVIAAGLFMIKKKNKPYQGQPPRQMLCMECGNSFEVSHQEVSKALAERAKTGGGPGAFIAICPKCGKQSGYPALKCNQCQEVFFPNYKAGDDWNKCSKCGNKVILSISQD